MKFIRQFGEKFDIEAIFQEVETLHEGVNEPFSEYKERMLTLKEQIINNDINNRRFIRDEKFKNTIFGRLKGSRNCKHSREQTNIYILMNC